MPRCASGSGVTFKIASIIPDGTEIIEQLVSAIGEIFESANQIHPPSRPRESSSESPLSSGAKPRRVESSHGVGSTPTLTTQYERRFRNRMSMCPYKRPYNSGTIWIRLLTSPSVMATLTCGKRPVGHSPAPSFPALFRFPKPCAQVRILPGAPTKDHFQRQFSIFTEIENLPHPYNPFVAGTMREKAPGRWDLRVFVGKDTVTGKPKQISRVYIAPRREPGAGKREAAKQLAALVAEVERGGHGGGTRHSVPCSTSGPPTARAWVARRRPCTRPAARSTSGFGRHSEPSFSTS
jgi:hypothetical protein